MAVISNVISTAATQNAYKSGQSLGAGRESGGAGATSFSEMVREAAGNAVDTMRQADKAAEAGLTGQADTQKVVEAALELESTVRIAVSMRDKFVQAYQEVMRMPI